MVPTRHIALPSLLSRLGWIVLALLALGIGLVSLRYALPSVPFPSNLPNFQIRRGWLVLHAVSASVALLTGPWQFLPIVRRRWIVAHRWLGRIYCLFVLIGWISSVPIAAHAAFGPVSSTGFLLLGAAWIVSTAMGYFMIRLRRINEHRQWMIRSYALTAAAITLRLYLPVLVSLGVAFPTAYRFVAWACWVFNLLFAEWLIRRSKYVDTGTFHQSAQR